ncbi:MAG: GreA/GreB family elongation factor [Chitinophagaceae bacterium]|nr:GreA/GreB family elongation factor [Chitinophagaceae bacterium]
MNTENPVVVAIEKDYALLKKLINTDLSAPHQMTLGHELERAIIVSEDAFPPHAIKLNSRVRVMNTETQVVKTFTIVLPNLADIRKSKISVLSPMGTALFGFRKGEHITWKLPKGLQKIEILDVWN